MMLRRYWIEFSNVVQDDLPAGVACGCGVTAYDLDDALRLVRDRVFGSTAKLPPVTKCIEDVDVSTLDDGHVLVNMGSPVKRGVWFPLGYE